MKSGVTTTWLLGGCQGGTTTILGVTSPKVRVVNLWTARALTERAPTLTRSDAVQAPVLPGAVVCTCGDQRATHVAPSKNVLLVSHVHSCQVGAHLPVVTTTCQDANFHCSFQLGVQKGCTNGEEWVRGGDVVGDVCRCTGDGVGWSRRNQRFHDQGNVRVPQICLAESVGLVDVIGGHFFMETIPVPDNNAL